MVEVKRRAERRKESWLRNMGMGIANTEQLFRLDMVGLPHRRPTSSSEEAL